MTEYRSNSSEETEQIASLVASELQSGDVLLLRGDMGVGKTVFTKGLCRALGVEEYVTSPTFTVVNEYEGTRFSIYHFDLYRIEDGDELIEIGFEEYLQSGGVCVIEWPQNAKEHMPAHRYVVEIVKEDLENGRKITFWRE